MEQVEVNNEVVPCVVLSDGTKVFPDGTIVEAGEVSTEDRLEVFEQRRNSIALKSTIADLPVDVKQATIYLAIISYELIGFNHADIAFLLNTNISHISAIVKLADYGRMKEFVVLKLFEAEKQDAKAILAQSAPYAATKMVKTMKEKGALGYMAAKDILGMQKIGEKSQDNAMHTLEIVIMKQEDVERASTDKLTITVGGNNV